MKHNKDRERRRAGAISLRVSGPGGVLRLSKAKLLMSIAALIALGSLAIAGTWAAWSVDDVNGGNTFSTTSVLIDDNTGFEAGAASNASGTAIFNVTNISPGSTIAPQCIAVDYTSTTAPSNMTLKASITNAQGSTLPNLLTMASATYITTSGTAVTPGTNNFATNCAGYPTGTVSANLGTAGASLTNWATTSQSTPYTASTVHNIWYKFTVGNPLLSSDCAAVCGKTIQVTFTWTLTAA